MAITVVKTRQQIKDGPPDPPTHNPDGTLTRAGAVKEAKKLWGEMGTISWDDTNPKRVWCIGRFGLTVGKDKTWEGALKASARRKARLDQRALDEMKQEAATLTNPIAED